MRILTLNAWNVFGPWERRRREIVRWIAEIDPDVVCLQEVWQSQTVDQPAQLLDDLAAAAVRFHATYAGLPYEGGNLGNAVFTREPPSATRVVKLTPGDPDDPERTLVGARIDGIWCMTTHLSAHLHQRDARHAQVSEIRAAIAMIISADPSTSVVLTGDLNASPDAPETQALLEHDDVLRPVDAWSVRRGDDEGETWSNETNPFTAGAGLPDGRVDYILVFPAPNSGAVDVPEARLACDRPLTGVMASDHFGVVADVFAHAGPVVLGDHGV